MKLSIIIPCYNSEKYLARCLQSIIKQTYRNIEIIVVNDGSSDGSENVIKEFMNIDDRIKYIYKENSGVSDARNEGLKIATGELVTFVDSDDEILENMYETLINVMVSNAADIVHCSYTRLDKNGTKHVGNTQEMHEHNHVEGMTHLLQGDLFTASPCNKIYKREIVESLRFDKRFKINEDVLFNYYAFKNAKKSIYIDSCFYIYHVEETSACKNTAKMKNAEDCYLVSQIMQEESIGQAYEELASIRFLNNKLNLYRVYENYAEKKDRKRIKELKQSIKEDMKKLQLGKNQKISAFLIVYFGGLYVFMYNIYDKLRKPNWDV